MTTNSTHERADGEIDFAALELLAPDLHVHVSGLLPLESLKHLRLASKHLCDKPIDPARVGKLRAHLGTSQSLDAFASAAREEGPPVQNFCGHPITKLKLPKDTAGTQLAELQETGLLDSIIDLDLSCTAITDEDITRLLELSNIVSLNLSFCHDITRRGISRLKGLTNLTHLNLSYCNVSHRNLESISHHLKLRSLDLHGCNNITNEGLRHLSELTGLEQLNLANCSGISGEGLEHISNLVNLTSMNLACLRDMTPEKMMSLSGLIKLQTLNLPACYEVDDQGLQRISSLLDLKSLDLSFCENVSDQGLAHLSNLLALRKLDLYRCDKISDRGLGHLSELSELRFLGLSSRRITDAGMQQIALSHELLEELQLTDCYISDRVKEYLKLRNKNLKISR